MDRNVIRILLIDDDEDDFILTKDILSDYDTAGFIIDWAPTFEDGEAALIENQYDVYLIDYLLGAHSGLELLQLATKIGVKVPIIMLTGKGDRAIDFEAMHLGAADYLVKGEIDHRALERSIRYSVEKYRSTNSLFEQELKYRSLFEKSIDAIFIASRSQTFMDVNKSFLQLLKYSDTDELGNITVQDIFATDDDFAQYSRQLQRSGYIKDLEAVLLSRDRQNILCVISAVELKNSEGIVTGYQGIIRDITDQKRTEQELRKAEKLAITGKLARTIAHEVRNPLTNISLSVDQMLSEHPGDESTAFYLDIVRRNLLRINKLVTELLDSARPSELKFTGQDINIVLEQALELTRDRLELRNIQVVKDIAIDIRPFPVDNERMQLALLNIIINAIEAMEQNKGILTLRTRQDNRICIMSIIDNGIGIGKEYTNLLFDAFYTGKRNGMGLGLTLAHNIIQGHKGTIEVFSEVGKGTEFRLSFDTGK